MGAVKEVLHNVSAFGSGVWRYWRRGEPAPESNYVVHKLYAYTDGRSNDFLFRMLESKRKEARPEFTWNGIALEGQNGNPDDGIDAAVRALKQDGMAVLPRRLTPDALQSLYQLALSARLDALNVAPLSQGEAPGTYTSFAFEKKGQVDGIDLSHASYSVYSVPRPLLVGNSYCQSLLCDPYLLTIATRYLGVFPVVTRPDMWWDTDCVPSGLRPRPFHTDRGCLRWLKVGVNLTDTTLETPHFVYVKGSHNPNKTTRQLTKRLAHRMNLSDKEVTDVCQDRIVHVTSPAGTITLTDTRGIHKGELSQRGHRLILYFGLEGSALNNTDKPVPLPADELGSELEKAMTARPFNYQFFQRIQSSNPAKKNGS